MRPATKSGAALAGAWALLTSTGLAGLAEASTLAFTRTSPLLPAIAIDAILVGESGSFTSVPLPTAPEPLEFPWDIDFANGRLFVVGIGQDNGTTPETRQLDDVDAGTIWSMRPDGSDPRIHASGLDRPLHLDVTPDGSTIFFAEQGTGSAGTFEDDGRIGRLDVETGEIETVVTAPADAGPTGVDFDPATGTLFYQVNNRGSDISVQQIRRVGAAAVATDLAPGADDLFLDNPVPTDGTLDDGDEFTVVSAGRNVAVHDGFVYFTYRNGAFTPSSEIRRVPIDFDRSTDDPESFETVVTGTRIIDFEIAGDELFWTDPQTDLGVFRVEIGLDGLPTGSATRVAQGLEDFSSLPIGVTVVPEPATARLFAAALLVLGALRRLRRR